jgi:lipopolysaccharide transport system permease protein
MSFISTSRIIQFRNDLELLIILAKRDISVRYKQTFLGILWAIIKPLVTMSVFLFAFKNVSNIRDLGGYPIQLVIFSGVLFWNFFANSFQFTSNSILTNSNLISKVYFPRIIIPISAVSVPLIDFIIGFIIYLILSFSLNYSISYNILYLPVAFLFLSLFSLGLGLIFSSFAIKHRDFLQVIPLIVQYGFFITPIIYTSNEIIAKTWFKYYLFINPLVGLVEFFRFSLIQGYQILSYFDFFISCLISVVVFILGLLTFKLKENTFVDYL